MSGNIEVKERRKYMNKIKIDKVETLLTMHVGSSEEEFIISVTKYEDDYTFGMHLKISTEDGNVIKNVLIPFDLLLPLKGMD